MFVIYLLCEVNENLKFFIFKFNALHLKIKNTFIFYYPSSKQITHIIIILLSCKKRIFMKQSKKAFSLIEMIFVIVILGILSSMMISYIMAARDDAKISLALSHVGQLVSEITIYYTSMAHFNSDLSEMSSVSDANYTEPWDENNETGGITFYTPKNKEGVEPCMHIALENQDGKMTISNISGSDGNVCSGLQQIKRYQQLLGTKLLIGNNIF